MQSLGERLERVREGLRETLSALVAARRRSAALTLRCMRILRTHSRAEPPSQVRACMHAEAGGACVLTEDSCMRACMQEFEVLKSQVEDEWARLCDPTQYEGKLFDLCAQFDMQQVRACACACVCVC